MSDNVGQENVESGAEVDEVVDDVLDDIERVLSSPPPPVEDYLGGIAEQLEEERLSMHAILPPASVALEDAWAHEDEDPTTEWRRPDDTQPSPESWQAFISYIEQARERTQRESIIAELDETPRPAAVSVSEPEVPATRRLPLPLIAVALISVGAAFVSYRLGPHSTAPTHVEPAAVTVDYRAPVVTQRLLVSVTPSNARLSIRGMGEPEGEPYAGPWPRAFDLAPGIYELVAFRGDQSVVSRVEIEPGVDPPPLALRLPATE